MMGLREGAAGVEGTPKVTGYLTAIVLGHHTPDKIGLRSMRELQTLARSLDLLEQGSLAELGDLLMQRFKAIEQSLADGNWAIANEMEIVPEALPTLASANEQQVAARAAYLRSKLDAAKRRSGAPPTR